MRRAYQHVLYLGQGDETNHPRIDRMLMFDQENQSALDGTVVWKELAAKGKAFDISAFNAKALLHNQNDGDYGQPLDEVRDLFWSSPRMPLLPGGDADLQRAIFEAIQSGTLRLVGADGLKRDVTRPGDIGVGQSGLRLAKPSTSVEDQQGEAKEDEHEERGEREVTFSLMTSLTDDTKREAVWPLLRTLAYAVDDGTASYVQLMVKVVVDSTVADKIDKEGRAAGTSPTVKEL